MDINLILTIIQLLSVIMALISVIILARTIQNNKYINQNNLFNEVVKQERELRIKLNEYREEIHIRENNSEENKEVKLDYHTLLYGVYTFLIEPVSLTDSTDSTDS